MYNMETLQVSSTSRPIVGLQMITHFQETVAMDLKIYKGKILSHLVDHFTRLSASSIMPNKNPEIVIIFIFKIWISVYDFLPTMVVNLGTANLLRCVKL